MSRKGCGCDGSDLDQFGKCPHDVCPKSQRVDGNGHSFVFDGDDPYVVCAYCKERRDAISGRIIPDVAVVKTTDIPISAAEQIAKRYGYDQIVIIGRKVGTDENAREHCTTYGIDKANCDVAAQMGDFLKFKVMGWKNV